jgi:uncharacterized membrane protein
MDAVLGTATLWLVMIGTHLGLASRRPREALVGRLGEQGYLTAFSLVAALSFTALVWFYAAHRTEGPPGLALGGVPLLRALLVTLIVAAFALGAASLVVYPRSPIAVFADGAGSPRGLERITRHSFFVAVTLIGTAHALLAPHLAGAVFTGGFAVLGLVGSWHQDRKLLRLRGEPYAAYLAVTSMIPFAAILSGRQRLVWRELPFGSLAAGIAVALLLRTRHDGVLAHGGVWLIVAVLGGAAVAGVQGYRRGRRVRRVRQGLAHGTP